MFSYPSYCEHTYTQDLAKLPNNLTALFAWICPDLVILAEGVGVSLRYLIRKTKFIQKEHFQLILDDKALCREKILSWVKLNYIDRWHIIVLI